ncbi:hypothetical protein ACFYTQ_04930 [Nocardia sp. NPDC004068]|uniref:hypothetical protein n=1 Tax=Nocardia sp. NPDC004068 TaxID=3364303 RepID=UPI00369F35FD
MTGFEVTQEQRTLAIICGASRWPRLNNFESNQGFSNTANQLSGYLTSENGLRIRPENLLWLFDSPEGSINQLDQIDAFFEERFRIFEAPSGAAVTIVLIYVGHGAFFGRERMYCLLLRDTHEPHLAATSLRVADLANALRARAPQSSQFIVLDACFAGVAFKDFQSDIQQIGYQKIENDLREVDARGVVLLCSASARNPAQLDRSGLATMFGHAMLEVLKAGDAELHGAMSLGHVYKLTRRYLEGFDNAPLPELHAPDQRSVDLCNMPLFPNPARSGTDTAINQVDQQAALITDNRDYARGVVQKRDALQDELRIAMSTLANTARSMHADISELTKNLVSAYELLRKQLDFDGLEEGIANDQTIDLQGLSLQHRRAMLMWTAQDMLRTSLGDISSHLYALVALESATPQSIKESWNVVIEGLEELQRQNPDDPWRLKRRLVFMQLPMDEFYNSRE